ncbi:glucose-6-phosphate isomerase [mine drainage metagenome]|uniref:Glucose-6-phosphate isomerase n=1 Tax=mine drainage metagenome TaxID=410659 RepID=A0A1J5QVF1_9ZZZZ
MINLRTRSVPAPEIVSDLTSILPRLAAKDPTLWGQAAQEEAASRLGWISSPSDASELLPRIAEHVSWARERGLDHVVLCGMGGSSLAPEVICNNYGKQLTIVDTTDPGQVLAAISNRLSHTVVVISSKSGSTVETDSAKRAFEAAFTNAGLHPTDHMIVVTDPGSPLEKSAADAGYRLLTADSNVGGRYSALTAFGLLPSALAGVDIAALVSDAVRASELVATSDSPAVTLGALLGAHEKNSPYFTLLAPHGIGDWIEQLVAESTGKSDHGLLPVVVETATSPGFTGPGILSICINEQTSADVEINAPLGAQFVLWEWATALAARVIGINPFDQPNVQESKTKTGLMLENIDQLTKKSESHFGAVEVFGDYQGESLAASLDHFFRQVPVHGYLALMVFLDRFADAKASHLRSAITELIAKPVTFGWGPRFLHSTGQFHKGNPKIGAFLQITGDVTIDAPIAGRAYSFHTLQMAQAVGDGQALLERGVPVLRLHLTNRSEGLLEIEKAIAELTLRRGAS